MISRCFGLLRLRFIAGGNGPRSLPSANLAYKTRADKFWANYRASQLYWKGASIYDVRTERGGRGKKCTNFVDKQYIFCVLSGGGGQNISKSCRRYIWKTLDAKMAGMDNRWRWRPLTMNNDATRRRCVIRRCDISRFSHTHAQNLCPLLLGKICCEEQVRWLARKNR